MEVFILRSTEKLLCWMIKHRIRYATGSKVGLFIIAASWKLADNRNNQKTSRIADKITRLVWGSLAHTSECESIETHHSDVMKSLSFAVVECASLCTARTETVKL